MSCLKFISASVLLALGICTAAQAVVLKIDPKATYLAVYDPVVRGTPNSAQAFSLSALGFSAGQELIIQRLGDFQEGPTGETQPSTGRLFTDTSTSLFAAFSSTNVIFSATGPVGGYYTSPRYRLPGAVYAGLPSAVSKNTFYGSYATDISQDFDVTNGVHVIVPSGASYMFFSANESLFGDNVDPDGDFAVSITAVPEPASYVLLLGGLGAIGVCGALRQKRSQTLNA